MPKLISSLIDRCVALIRHGFLSQKAVESERFTEGNAFEEASAPADGGRGSFPLDPRICAESAVGDNPFRGR